MKRAALVLALLANGCTKAELLDFAMHTAPRPTTAAATRVGDYQVLAGDMHTHVLPPDSPRHVTRGLPETVALAKEEGLDFVVLTPHVSARFYLSEERDWVRRTQAELRRTIAAQHADVMVVPGMEYTDHRYGHVGLAFAEIEDVLAEVPEGDSRPERFFERWAAHGGLMTINHPVVRGIPHAPFMELRYELGWRALFDPPPPVPSEIAWITEHATAIETLNSSISHLRDQFIIGDVDRTLREGAHLADRVARTQHRPVTPVGGSDSHGGWLRPTTWVLARERSIAGVRDAIVNGRTCVRGPAACTFEARAPGGAFVNVGAALASGDARTVEVRTAGARATYYVNGAPVADGNHASLAVPGTCVLVRAVVDESWSAPIYVDCPWLTNGLTN